MTHRVVLAGHAGHVMLLAALVLSVAGCSGVGSVGTPTVAREEVEQEIATRLASTVGREPESLACPDDLPGKVDQQMRCTLNDAGTQLGVTVTVTSVEGNDVMFAIEVDATPR